FFRGGAPESVKSNRLSECLGRVMVRERMISEADCEESLKRMKASGRQQGTVLIEMGCISPHNLRYALELQLRLKLLEVFGWTRGEFQFNPKAQPPPETVRLQMSTAAIVYEGIRRSYDTARLLRALGEIAGKYVHPAEDPLFAAQDMSLGEEESGLLALMDGGRTVRELRRRGPLSPLDTGRFPVRAGLRPDGGAPEQAPDRPATAGAAPGRRAAGARGSPLGRRRGGSRARGRGAGQRRRGAPAGAAARSARSHAPDGLLRAAGAPARCTRRGGAVGGGGAAPRVPGGRFDQLGRGGDRGAADRRPRGSGARHPGRAGLAGPVRSRASGGRGEARGGRGRGPDAGGRERLPERGAAPRLRGRARGVLGVQRGGAAAARGGRVPGAPGGDHLRPGAGRRRRRSTGAGPARGGGGAESHPGPRARLQGSRAQGAGTDRRGAG